MTLSEQSESKGKDNKWFVYIAQARTGYLYTGVSNDVLNRIIKHNSGRGSKFASLHGAMKLLYQSDPMSKTDALKREIQIKGWRRDKKEMLIKSLWN